MVLARLHARTACYWKHLVAQVCVVGDGACSLRAGGAEPSPAGRALTSAEAGHEVGDELWKVGIQHALHRAGASARWLS